MRRPTKKQMEKWMKNQEEKAKEFKLKAKDIHNLYDLFYMTNWMDYETVKLNGLKRWHNKFFDRLDKFCITERSDKEEGK